MWGPLRTYSVFSSICTPSPSRFADPFQWTQKLFCGFCVGRSPTPCCPPDATSIFTTSQPRAGKVDSGALLVSGTSQVRRPALVSPSRPFARARADSFPSFPNASVRHSLSRAHAPFTPSLPPCPPASLLHTLRCMCTFASGYTPSRAIFCLALVQFEPCFRGRPIRND
jgi:hypothetical protein